MPQLDHARCPAHYRLCLLVLLFVLLNPPTAALAQSNGLSQAPSWTSEEALTLGIALGDVDVDGDLDLVCGNWDAGSTLYENIDGMLSVSPTWTSDTGDSTRAVALGDVNGDGYLDLVVGNWRQQNALYLNEGGVLSTTPAWRSHHANWTYSVVLADVDGDRDLDLICGNTDQGNTVYLNDNGVFPSVPWWQSQAPHRTRSIALGDVTGNGYLDLVCGNWAQPNTMYRNDGGVLTDTPIWSSEPAGNTWSVALGDIDGDGALDLVCGNSEQGNTAYLNQGGVLDSVPAWTCDANALTLSVALGDIDGDGDLDLACGNGDRGDALYVYDEGMLSVESEWSAESENHVTSSVALGDLDGDGDLDLVCGSSLGGSAFYQNNAPVVSAEPVWSTSAAFVTHGVAIGDLDGDGRPDIVLGNDDPVPSRAYLNRGGLAFSPAWAPAHALDTRDIALGDMDGDQDLDLVVGCFFDPAVMYSNDDAEIWSTAKFPIPGVLTVTPTWISTATGVQAFAIALGDVDGDGDLDLVCGRGTDTQWLYRNDAGTLTSDPTWASDDEAATTSVALGDVDRDGDLDLVCGAREDPAYGATRLYMNQQGVLDAMPVWQLPPSINTWDVALGDLDGDGYLDLVCANDDQPSAVYLNQNGQLSPTPLMWAPLSHRTQDVALADVDIDGDLDLVLGNIGSNAVYLNVGTSGDPCDPILSEVPLSRSPDEVNTQSVALSDLDGDGDLDLVCGNADARTTLHAGLRAPVFKGDPLAPKHQLANNPSFLRDVRVTAPDVNMRQITFTAFDVESDPVWVVADWQFEGAPTYFPADVLGGLQAIGPLGTSPHGIEHEFQWNVTGVPFDQRSITLRLRTVPIPTRVSRVQHIATYLKTVGRIEPRRSELTTSTAVLSFATVTVGDTVSVALTLENTGTAPLTILEVRLPSSEMRHGPLPDHDLHPGDSWELTIDLEPRQELDVSGPVEIDSTDPLTHALPLSVETDIRALDVTSRLLVSEEEEDVPLGTDLTVLVTPADEVRVEHGTVYYGAVGSAGFNSTPLLPFHEEFTAIIPGDHVTEAGLRYYVEVENSGVTSTDPHGAPDSVFVVPVHVPALVTSRPQATSGGGFLQGREITVQLYPQEGTIVESGTLYYREGGAVSGYATAAVETDAPLPFAVVPETAVGPRGVEYWVEIQTLTSALTDPAVDPAQHPHVIRTTVSSLAESETHPGRLYRMVSVPLDFGPDFAGTLQALLGDQAAFGVYDSTRWRSFRWIPALEDYTEHDSEDPAHVVRPGRAFWLIAREPGAIDTAPVAGTSIPTDSAYPVELQPGWNQIGNPFNFPVAWDSVRVDTLSAGGMVTLTMAEAELTVVDPPVGVNGAAGELCPGDSVYVCGVQVLDPFDGYWVKNRSSSGVVTLRIPAREAVVGAEPGGTPSTAGGESGDEREAQASWAIRILGVSAGARQAAGVAAVVPEAKTEWDARDRGEPPMVPGRALSVYFPHGEWAQHPGPYGVDVRGDPEPLPTDLSRAVGGEERWGYVWCFDVVKSFSDSRPGDPVTLLVEPVGELPADARLVLVDRHRQTSVDLGVEPDYTFHLGRRGRVTERGDARFALVVGSETFVAETALPAPPAVTALHRSYPNPFYPSTVVRYDVARAGRIVVSVYDIGGAQVRSLYRGHREAGRYEIQWDGRDSAGRLVSSGVYFIRLRSDELTVSRKTIMVK